MIIISLHIRIRILKVFLYFFIYLRNFAGYQVIMHFSDVGVVSFILLR